MKNVAGKIALILLTVVLLSGNSVYSQNYKTALGLRGGLPSGITVKHFFAQKSAIEGIVSFGWGGIGVTGLYEIHNAIPDASGLDWYYGFGAHIATANSDKDNPFESGSGSAFFLGADGIIGLEYTFKEAPINLSVDIIPIFNIIESPGIWFNGGISIRYTF